MFWTYIAVLWIGLLSGWAIATLCRMAKDPVDCSRDEPEDVFVVEERPESTRIECPNCGRLETLKLDPPKQMWYCRRCGQLLTTGRGFI